LTDVQPLALGNGGFTVRVGGPTPFRLYAVHTAMLLGAPHRWHDDLALLRKRLAEDVRGGPVLAVGDWNATYSHVPMRRVLMGEDVAQRQSGRGLASRALAQELRRRLPAVPGVAP